MRRVDDVFTSRFPRVEDSVLVLTQNLMWDRVERNARTALFASMVERLDVDVLLLQEVPPVDVDEFFAPLVAAGFHVDAVSDANSLSSSSSSRFLAGVEPFEGRTAQRTDAWDVAGDGPGFTSTPDNLWAHLTASLHGFPDPGRRPHSRIDRLLVRGYAYGRPLCPLSATVIGADVFTMFCAPFPVSDHWGVLTDLWDPPVTA